jgi:beta-lactamase regulating signal transducer with metallopeptidase domain
MSTENILGTVLASLLNSLWQSATIALLVWMVLRFLPRMRVKINAATRCAAWWAVLAAIISLPMTPQPRKESNVTTISYEALTLPAPAAPVSVVSTPPAPTRSLGALRISAGAGLIAILAVWLALSLFRIVQIARSYRYLRSVTRRGQAVLPEQRVHFDHWVLACAIDRPVRLLVSSEIVSPMAVGFRRPAVLVPETLLNQFTGEELDHVILPELAHIARRDDWTNLLARLIGALLPVHPVAMWVLKRIEQDREIACDDWVVAMTGDARPYAASLTRLFELCSARRRQLLATGMAGRASHLGDRIEALLRGGREFVPRVSMFGVMLAAVILVGLVLVGAQAPDWIAFAQAPAFPPEPAFAQEPPVPPAAPIAPVQPIAPIPPARPTPLQGPGPLVPNDLHEMQRDVANLQQEIQQSVQDLQQRQRQLKEQSRKLNGNHPDQLAVETEMRALEQQIRGREAEVRAAEAQIVAAEARIRAQQQQLRAQQGGQGTSGSFLAALVAAGYGGISVDEIIDLRNHGVSGEFLRALSQSGVGKLSTKDLIALAENGVQPDLFRALRQAFPQITPREIVEAAQSGLQPDDLRQAKEFSPNLTLPQIIRLKQAGVI